MSRTRRPIDPDIQALTCSPHWGAGAGAGSGTPHGATTGWSKNTTTLTMDSGGTDPLLAVSA